MTREQTQPATATATDDAPAATVLPADHELMEYNAEVLDSRPGVREAFMLMLTEVPDAAGDAVAGIVAQILQAERVEDLDRPWDAEGMREFIGRQIRVESLHKMPSDYAKGLGCYLVCQITDVGSGEQLVLTTGSVSIVAQLVRAYTLNALPLTVVPVQSDKPSKNGYYPMHVELVRERRPR